VTPVPPLPTVLAATLCLALLARPVAAQQQPSPDPRDEDDPRVVEVDPRTLVDPREADVEAQDETRIEDLEGAALFTALQERGDLPALARSLAEAPWEALPHVEAQLKRWHGVRAGVSGPDAEAAASATALAAELARQLEELARVADEAVGDSQFVQLVDRHLSWSDSELLEYAEGQALVQEAEALIEVATAADELDRALTPLRRALALQQPLGDLAGQGRALLLVGRIESLDAGGGIDQQTLDEVLRLGRSIRDLDTVWTSLGLLYEAAIHDVDYDRAEEILVEQYQIAHETDDQGSARQVMRRLLDLQRHRDQTGL